MQSLNILVSIAFYYLVLVSVLTKESKSSLRVTSKDTTRILVISGVIRDTTSSNVYDKGSNQYNKRRIVHNGLCRNVFPDTVVVPKSTEDVSRIVKIARYYNVPISVRSGGHSFTCTNIKQRGIRIDL